MKIKILMCNCRGLDAAFNRLDTRTLTSDVSEELAIDYTILHPELCGDGGRAAFAEALHDWDRDTYIICGACAPEIQLGFVTELARERGIPYDHIVPVDIRSADNEHIVNRLRQSVEAIVGIEPAP